MGKIKLSLPNAKPNHLNPPSDIYNEQLQRIKDKLDMAGSADPEFNADEADSHEYFLNRPATEEEVLHFERRYAVKLPLCYRSFLLQVGNGGRGHSSSGAGPYYGIYPLGTGVDDLIRNNAEEHLRNGCMIAPDMTADRWKSLTLTCYRGKLFGGILPLGSQGCTYVHALVLNGPHKGRVVNLDFDCLTPPIFSYGTNFLDWYEKWLDEIIDGTLQKPDAMFGYGSQ